VSGGKERGDKKEESGDIRRDKPEVEVSGSQNVPLERYQRKVIRGVLGRGWKARSQGGNNLEAAIDRR